MLICRLVQKYKIKTHHFEIVAVAVKFSSPETYALKNLPTTDGWWVMRFFLSKKTARENVLGQSLVRIFKKFATVQNERPGRWWVLQKIRHRINQQQTYLACTSLSLSCRGESRTEQTSALVFILSFCCEELVNVLYVKQYKE